MSANVALDRLFYAREPKTVATQLLGKLLVSTIAGKKAAGIIVETEAYLSSRDTACHGHRGPTKKNSTMFGPAGFGYVYSIHAKYCFNVVTQTNELASAVLIRAIQPVAGVRSMQLNRNQDRLLNLCSGPAKLCQALGIDIAIDGIDLTCRRKVWIEDNDQSDREIQIKVTRRIGVTSANNLDLRFVIADHPFASGPKYLR